MPEQKETIVVMGDTKSGKVSRGRWLAITGLFLLVVAAAGLVVYLLEGHYGVNKPAGNSSRSSNIRHAEAFENSAKTSDQKYLDDKDYAKYQTSLSFYFDSYMANKDYDASEKVLNNILHNVPADKLSVDTYADLSILYKAKHDDKKYRHYTEILIEKLKQQGYTKEAESYMEQLGRG